MVCRFTIYGSFVSNQLVNLRSVVGVSAISKLKDGAVVLIDVVWVGLRDLVRAGEGVAWNVVGTDTIRLLVTEASVSVTTRKVGVLMAVVDDRPVSIKKLFSQRLSFLRLFSCASVCACVCACVCVSVRYGGSAEVSWPWVKGYCIPW